MDDLKSTNGIIIGGKKIIQRFGILNMQMFESMTGPEPIKIDHPEKPFRITPYQSASDCIVGKTQMKIWSLLLEW